ncbi:MULTISPECIES: DegV family protein [unclassified Ruminococcus]|uniref:DegV family protein n=1 Tax=unclassified Ruminococcus TaxID=2608920 RepID=UPI002109075B|nr:MULTISPECIES: DegV family protein [unclassified Ruminococcus]MCQ4021612.1 DegV family EDD domain-containing protein [Ruminococcus sp. zg-924]MCQ4114057.1 DegV family EDD domain-containing protein [Ruminococcus sp. zg-921]
MSEYALFSDSTLDLTAELCEKYDITVIPMTVTLGGIAYKYNVDEKELSCTEFYEKLKGGAACSTSQINYKDFKDSFEPVLKEGKDILYICFTSGMSSTFGTCNIAINDLKEKYPDRKIIVIDSLSASIGEGVLVLNAAKMRQNGTDIDTLAKWVEDNRLKACHWFVVDDLDQLKRGGRISPTAAAFGKALGIRPLISVDLNGKLVPIAKIRGQQKVYSEIVSRLISDGVNATEQTVVIGHANCPEKAEELKKILKEKKLVKHVVIAKVGPIIGAHVGNGMVALAFMGKRNI